METVYVPKCDDAAWAPWKQAPPARVSRAEIPLVVPPDKVGRYVICSKHNKMRIIFACEPVPKEEGAERGSGVLYQCKERDTCSSRFQQPDTAPNTTTASPASPTTPGGPGGEAVVLPTAPTAPPANNATSNNKRYFEFTYKDEEPPKVCWTCGSEDHEVTACPFSVCTKCFVPMKSHNAAECNESKHNYDVCHIDLRDRDRQDMICVVCGRNSHADCSKPMVPQKQYCANCGANNHHAFYCGHAKRRREHSVSHYSQVPEQSSQQQQQPPQNHGGRDCYLCGKIGHISRDCPNRNSNRGGGDYDREGSGRNQHRRYNNDVPQPPYSSYRQDSGDKWGRDRQDSSDKWGRQDSTPSNNSDKWGREYSEGSRSRNNNSGSGYRGRESNSNYHNDGGRGPRSNENSQGGGKGPYRSPGVSNAHYRSF